MKVLAAYERIQLEKAERGNATREGKHMAALRLHMENHIGETVVTDGAVTRTAITTDGDTTRDCIATVDGKVDRLTAFLTPGAKAFAKAVEKTLHAEMNSSYKVAKAACRAVEKALSAKSSASSAGGQSGAVQRRAEKANKAYDEKLEIAKSAVDCFVTKYTQKECKQLRDNLRGSLAQATVQ